jgi:hypothetical protein
MKNNSEKGFALVLSLVLMVVMSLMGGALIIISAGDHASNNESDNYQQTFYVAETGLLEGERALLNQFLGPLTDFQVRDRNARNLPQNDTNAFTGDLTRVNYTIGKEFSIKFDRETLDYKFVDTKKICFESFRDIADTSNITTYIAKDNNGDLMAKSYNFGKLLSKSFNTNDATTEEKNQAQMLSFYYYEYFIQRVGSAPFRGSGSSIKKGATDTGNDGMAYRVYACGIRAGEGIDPIVVPLESVVVLPR